MNRLFVPAVGLLLVVGAVSPFLSRASAADDALNKRVQAAIDKVHHRPLTSEKNMPWVIMHAVIAFEKDLQVTNSDTGEKENAIDFLLKHSKWEGKSIWRNDNGRPWLPTRGISQEIRGRSFLVQDHVDQFLFAFADADVPLDSTFIAEGGQEFSLKQLFDVSKNEFKSTQELGWTLYCLAAYHPVDFKWKSADGKEWSTEMVAQLAAERDPRRETEGGPHHLYGVAFAVNQWKKANPGKKPTGGWEVADEYVKYYAQVAKEFQNDDGSFSAAGFRGKSKARDARGVVSATGHALEWLTQALDAEQLKEQWVTNAVEHLTKTIEDNDVETFSDGGMYHAAHALRRYLEKTKATVQ